MTTQQFDPVTGEIVPRRTIIVSGNVLNGFEFFGPFESDRDAERIVERWDDTDWWIVELQPKENAE